MAVRLYPSFKSDYPADAELFFNICLAMHMTQDQDFDLDGYLQARERYHQDYSYENFKALVKHPTWDIVHKQEVFGFGRFTNPQGFSHVGEVTTRLEKNEIVRENWHLFCHVPPLLFAMIDGFHWS